MKRKFTLWLNILTICLCVCIIAIGVYSVQNASLTISGSVGFKAHNCDGDITAYIWGDSVVTDSSTSESVAEGETVRSQTNRKQCDTKKEVRGETGDKSLALGKMYFGDRTDDGSISPITIEFDVVNQSAFAIDVEITDISIKVGDDDCTYITPKRLQSDGIELASKGSTGKLSLQLTLKPGMDTLEKTPEISFNISMRKHSASSNLTSTWSSGIFNSSSPFGSDIPTLNASKINSISFIRELPIDIDTYSKAESLNLANNKSTESPITAYAKASATANLYDVIIYSPGKIYETSCASMFSNWTNLTSIQFNNFYTKNVTDMSSMFYRCGALSTLDLSNFDTSNVEDMNDMFATYSNNKFTNLDLRNFDTSKVKNMSGMFSYFGGPTSLDLSSFDTSNVENMSSMFYYFESLTKIYVTPYNAETGKGWNVGDGTNSSYMFSLCSNLVGGAGTTYDSSYKDATYARIDTASTPGYLTDIADKGA